MTVKRYRRRRVTNVNWRAAYLLRYGTLAKVDPQSRELVNTLEGLANHFKINMDQIVYGLARVEKSIYG